MTLWTDIAQWRGPVLHHSGTIADHMYVVIHTADGTYEGTIAWQKNPDSGNSSHFVVDFDGKIAQVNDTANRSGAQINGNPFSIAIENAGNENTPLTPQQIDANAKILAKAHQVHGIPLQLTGKVGTRGLGHHSMGAESGANWGHALCPGSIIKAQKPAILARAVQIVQSGSFSGASTKGTDMILVKGGNGDVFLTGPTPLHVSGAQLSDLQSAGVPLATMDSTADRDAVLNSQRQPLVNAADVAAALAGNDAFITAIANAVGASVKDQFGPAFDARIVAAVNVAEDS